jgi:hypothetical protein
MKDVMVVCVCRQSKRKSVQQSVDAKIVGENIPEQEQDDKRVKLDDGSQSDRKLRDDVRTNKSTASSVAIGKPPAPVRCNQCRQLLDDPDLRMFSGDPCEAVGLTINCITFMRSVMHI